MLLLISWLQPCAMMCQYSGSNCFFIISACSNFCLLSNQCGEKMLSSRSDGGEAAAALCVCRELLFGFITWISFPPTAPYVVLFCVINQFLQPQKYNPSHFTQIPTTYVFDAPGVSVTCHISKKWLRQEFIEQQLQQLEVSPRMAASQASAEINLRWKSVVRVSSPHCVWEQRVCTLHHPRLQKKEPLGIAFNFISEKRCVRLGAPSLPVYSGVSGCDWRCARTGSPPSFPPGAAETSCSPLTRRLCRSCAALRCPVSNRIYLAAAGCMTGCRRPNEALNTQVRCPGGWFLSISFICERMLGARKLLKLRRAPSGWPKCASCLGESKARQSILRTDDFINCILSDIFSRVEMLPTDLRRQRTGKQAIKNPKCIWKCCFLKCESSPLSQFKLLVLIVLHKTHHEVVKGTWPRWERTDQGGLWALHFNNCWNP